VTQKKKPPSGTRAAGQKKIRDGPMVRRHEKPRLGGKGTEKKSGVTGLDETLLKKGKVCSGNNSTKPRK